MPGRSNSRVILSPTVDVVGVGLNAMDYISVVDEFPRPNSKLEIRQVRLEPGGQVATALTTCRRLGLRARYIGSVGSDDLGRVQMESLRAEGLDVEFVRVVEGAGTQVAFILVEESVGERTILWHRDPRLRFPAADLSSESITTARLLHLDGRDTEAALLSAQWANKAGIPVVIDIDQIYDSSTEELLSRVDYLIAAEDFAKRVTGRTDSEGLVRSLGERYGAAVTGVTLGGRGAVFLQDGRLMESPAFEVPVKDTTGAGDVFHGAFIFGVLEGWALEETIRFAHAVAAIKCMELGARAGIPGMEKVRSFLKTATERPGRQDDVSS
jgi:sulfofructose kinase